MKTLVQQIQEIMECAEQHVQVVEVRPVPSAVGDQQDFQSEQTGSIVATEEVRPN
jgi:hypothetical protein